MVFMIIPTARQPKYFDAKQPLSWRAFLSLGMLHNWHYNTAATSDRTKAVFIMSIM